MRNKNNIIKTKPFEYISYLWKRLKNKYITKNFFAVLKMIIEIGFHTFMFLSVIFLILNIATKINKLFCELSSNTFLDLNLVILFIITMIGLVWLQIQAYKLLKKRILKVYKNTKKLLTSKNENIYKIK